MVHVTDWFPTILRLAGAPAEDVKDLEIDGVDQYDTFFAYDASGDQRYKFGIEVETHKTCLML